jgi:hypothetical protein
MVIYKSEFTSLIESKINSIIQKKITGSNTTLIIASLCWIELLLSKQKKSDYTIKEGVIENTVATQTSNQIIEFLRSLTEEAFDMLDDHNREAYFLEIGTSFCK